MEPATAALIGAGVAAIVNVIGIVATHALALNREATAERRRRLLDLIDAATDAMTVSYSQVADMEGPARGATFHAAQTVQASRYRESLILEFGRGSAVVESYERACDSMLDIMIASDTLFEDALTDAQLRERLLSIARDSRQVSAVWLRTARDAAEDVARGKRWRHWA